MGILLSKVIYVELNGGELDGASFSDPATVHEYARHIQLDEIFEFDRATLKLDGVFRNSLRGWTMVYFRSHHICSTLFLWAYQA